LASHCDSPSSFISVSSFTLPTEERRVRFWSKNRRRPGILQSEEINPKAIFPRHFYVEVTPKMMYGETVRNDMDGNYC